METWVFRAWNIHGIDNVNLWIFFYFFRFLEIQSLAEYTSLKLSISIFNNFFNTGSIYEMSAASDSESARQSLYDVRVFLTAHPNISNQSIHSETDMSLINIEKIGLSALSTCNLCS